MEPHEILGIEKTATEAQIRAAYKSLAKKWHPDRQPNNREEATQKFAEINGANRKMLRLLRRARRAAESATDTSDKPSTAVNLAKPTPSESSENCSNSGADPPSSSESESSCSSGGSGNSSETSNTSFSGANSSSPSTFLPSGSEEASASPSSSPSFKSHTTPASSQSSSFNFGQAHRSRLRKPKEANPNATLHTSPSTSTSPSQSAEHLPSYFPERVDGTLRPERPILRGGGADMSKTWTHVLPMTLEELFFGKTFHFRIVRHRLTGKKRVVPLTVEVPVGCREGSEIVYAGVGNELKDGQWQDVIFRIRELKHERFRRIHDDLVMDVSLPWVDSLDREEGKVHFQGVDGKDTTFKIAYFKRRVLSGTTVIPEAGMPSRSGTGRGNFIVRWEISSPRSSWQTLKEKLRFKSGTD